jgi:hypothetical protein
MTRRIQTVRQTGKKVLSEGETNEKQIRTAENQGNVFFMGGNIADIAISGQAGT